MPDACFVAQLEVFFTYDKPISLCHHSMIDYICVMVYYISKETLMQAQHVCVLDSAKAYI